jgi:hypothetical protein
VRFRLYVDESGDHTYRNLDDVSHRYLGLTGIAIESDYYRLKFQPELEALKQRHFPHSPDEPVILHRDDICNYRGAFGVLDDPNRNAAWEKDFADFVRAAQFELFTVIIDKKTHKERYGDSASHPYHYCLTLLLERYRGYLISGRLSERAKGDVLAEGRGGQEDLALKKVYREVWGNGTYFISAQEFQKVLTSKELKVRYKDHNIAGLQLADLLAHPSKLHILSSRGKIPQSPTSFGTRLAQLFQGKYNPYGKVLLE